MDNVKEISRFLELLSGQDWVEIPYGGDNPVQAKIYEVSVALNGYRRDGCREVSQTLRSNEQELEELVRGLSQRAG